MANFMNPMMERIGGLLDPLQQRMEGLPANPFFQTGMGILGANLDPNQNVFQGAVAGLQSARQQQQAEEDRQRMEELRARLAELFAQQSPQMSGPSIYEPMTMNMGAPLQSPVMQPPRADQLLQDALYGGIYG